MENDIAHITHLLKQLYDIDIAGYEQTFLDRSIRLRIAEIQCESFQDYINILKDNSLEANTLISSLNVSYSEFFRNSLTFSVLEQLVLPLLCVGKKSDRKKEIRIWSLACASGQEAYSIAMFMEELISNTCQHINYRIFATDQSQEQVKKAQKGQYQQESMGNLSLRRINKWFNKDDETFTVKKELKKNIDFSVFNLLSDPLSSPAGSIFGDFDIVICANILFYYKKKFRNTIVEKAGNCLAKGGFLVTGETERDIILKYNFREVFPQAAVFQVKK
jgi:chemotaxis protein methyltransferase CheR